MNGGTVWLACGVLRAELEELRRRGSIQGELRFLCSMLHMAPQELERAVASLLQEESGKGRRLVLAYGDCCSRMLDLARQFGASRVDAINCAQMLTGKARYRELMKRQSFMLLPEWAPRWREIIQDRLGLSSELASELMGENRGELVYLDTGIVPPPQAELAECAAYTRLPCRIEAVGLETLLSLLLKAEAAAEKPS